MLPSNCTILTRSRSRTVAISTEDGLPLPSSQSDSFSPEEDQDIQKKKKKKKRTEGRGERGVVLPQISWVCIILDSSKNFEGSRSSIVSLKDLSYIIGY